MKQSSLKQFEVSIDIYECNGRTKKYIRMRFSKWLHEQVENWSFIITGKDSIRFSREPNSRRKIHDDYTIWCKSFIVALLKNNGFTLEPQSVVCPFSYTQCGGIVDIKFNMSQAYRISYVITRTPQLQLPSPDEPEFESQEDVLERVKKDVIYLKSVGVKCSFSYETTKVVTETI